MLYRIPAVAGCVIWRADPGSLEIRRHTGTLANSLWFVVAGHRYAVVYAHATQQIVVRDRVQNGPVVMAIDDETTDVALIQAFRALPHLNSAASATKTG